MIICYDNQIINLYMGWRAIYITVCRDFGWEISPLFILLPLSLMINLLVTWVFLQKMSIVWQK